MSQDFAYEGVMIVQRRKSHFVFAVIVFVLGGCASGFQATHDHDPGHDFRAYQTFAWISERPMRVAASAAAPNPLLEPRIMSAISDALAAKGYTRVDQATAANFAVSFTLGSREQIKVDSYPSMAGGYGAYGRSRRWGAAYYGYGTETTVRQYTEGVLAIDIFDTKESRPVWHGVASKSISKSDREDIVGTVKAAVDAILTDFPPS